MNHSLVMRRAAINPFYRKDETQVVDALLGAFPLKDREDEVIRQRAAGWVRILRAQPSERTLLEDFMHRYSLSTPEGVALMSIAECVLRVPDMAMADKVIIDKITSADWSNASVEGEKLVTRLSGWGLAISEIVLGQKDGMLGRLTKRLGLPIIRQAVAHAIKLLGGQFACGRTIDEAITNAARWKKKHYLFSYDMLGEGARMAETAEAYYKSYQDAIRAVGERRDQEGLAGDMYANDSISVKLSALHPRYEELQRVRCLPVLIERVRALVILAMQYDLMVTLDAEEAERLEISLDIFEAVLRDPALKDYHGLGLAVQAYQKRTVPVIDYLIALARDSGKRIPIRLVKGAYWDSEIKKAQERGLSGYPVFTRKAATDVSYLLAAEKMLAAHDVIYPALGTHNAYTISAILSLAEKHGCTSYEFQRLHGMGEQLYDAAYRTASAMPPCRIYAPVGAHQDLLPYLVRRLLENGANSSFVHQVYDKNLPVEELTQNPASYLAQQAQKPHPRIALPQNLYGMRKNSVAPDLSDREDCAQLLKGLEKYKTSWRIQLETSTDGEGMMQKAQSSFGAWKERPVMERAAILDRIADAYEAHRDELLALCVYEGKKTIPDAITEWREAVDFCRYYAEQARLHFAEPIELPGPTGERNLLKMQGRGVFVCISPWNFPLAIFTGQVVAALVSGNAVIAKPAEQTPTVAKRAVDLMHQAGVPKDVLQLAIGKGSKIGAALVGHLLTAGVVFTGSTETAWIIQKTLAEKRGPIVPFIAETGGQNAMIVDSTALAEQVVDDVIRSAFFSAGQRCSALRVLYLQDEIAQPVLKMLIGAMRELVIGDPYDLATDIGPVIDEEARCALAEHARNLQAQRIAIAPQSDATGSFVLPQVYTINAIGELDKENFGPILHIITYKAGDLDKIIDDINAVGYGLTLGIHSRIEERAEYIAQRVNAGNIYINRGMTGAVVGVQPFGGMGLSGTGPKAGGPHYLYRFVNEKTISINTTAAGGNTTLTTLHENAAPLE